MDNCWTETLLANHLAYSFLSKAFYEAPDAAFIGLLASESLFNDWMLDGGEDGQTGLRLLRAVCDGWDDSQIAALKRDYERLFVGPDHLLAAPWESVYVSRDHLMFDTQTLDVRAVYQQFGMPIPNLHTEPDDHIGLELRFVAYLCSAGLNALEQGQSHLLRRFENTIHHFLVEHLLVWSDQFLANVIEHAQTDFYRGAAYLTRGCLRETARVFELAETTGESG